MFTIRGLSSPCIANHGLKLSNSSLSPPKITSRSLRSPLRSLLASACCSPPNAVGVWFRTVTPSAASSSWNSSGDRLTR